MGLHHADISVGIMERMHFGKCIDGIELVCPCNSCDIIYARSDKRATVAEDQCVEKMIRLQTIMCLSSMKALQNEP